MGGSELQSSLQERCLPAALDGHRFQKVGHIGAWPGAGWEADAAAPEGAAHRAHRRRWGVVVRREVCQPERVDFRRQRVAEYLGALVVTQVTAPAADALLQERRVA